MILQNEMAGARAGHENAAGSVSYRVTTTRVPTFTRL